MVSKETLDNGSTYKGEEWVCLTGSAMSGTFSQKPAHSDGIKEGFSYFCTDKKTAEGTTNGIMIYYKGNDVWVDAMGRVIN